VETQPTPVAQPQTTEPTATNSQTPAPVSEVKEAAAQTPAVETEQPKAQEPTKAEAVADSQATQTKGSVSEAALFEIEETLKGLDPKEVLQFQRELSAERGENLFVGKVGELFNKYKPKATERAEKVKSLAAALKQADKPASTPTPAPAPIPQETVKGNEPNPNEELLKAKVELELIKNGVSNDFLEEATIVAMSKVKSLNELSKVNEVANKFAKFGKTGDAPAIPPRTSVGIGEHKDEMTEGEKAVAYLRSKNPNGWKK